MNQVEKILSALEGQIAKALTDVRTEAHRMDDASKAATGGAILSVQQCKIEGPLSTSRNVESIGLVPGIYGMHQSWAIIVAKSRKVLADACTALELAHAGNLAAIENNIKVREQVRLIMENLGIKAESSTYGYAKPSARKMTWTRKPAGYISDLATSCPISDGYEALKKTLESVAGNIDRYEALGKAKEQAEESAKAEVAKDRENLILLGAVSARYGQAADVDELVELMCKKDKYLGLAYALEQNRNDWSDGYSYAERGLDDFEAATPEDHRIVTEIQRSIDDWDGDGRVFRENYGELYGMVAPEILTDFYSIRNSGMLS